VEQFSVTTEAAAELAAAIADVAVTGGVRCVMVVDRAGRMLAAAGDLAGDDAVTFASLTAADFNANEQLARLVGERGFRALVHRGENASVHVEDAAGRAVVVTLYGPAAPPGLVRELAREASERVAAAVTRTIERSRSQTPARRPLLEGADDEIDRLFDW
jgi:predicted regulator of Ras-like GTPase activity (Roadblock/LC7/MglB family)